jgi:hypothetical protein
MGMTVVGLGVLGLGVLFLLLTTVLGGTAADMPRLVNVLTGFSFGASSVALFARLGGGIYTKAADVGADLVGKVEAGIPEDHPLNPATIADNVGDNVGDVAGMGADLFESYVGAILGAMVLGAVSCSNPEFAGLYGGLSMVLLPMLLGAAGVLASVIGTFFVRGDENVDPQKALNRGELIAAGVMLVASWLIINSVLPPSWKSPEGLTVTRMGAFYASLIGLGAGIAIGFVTEYYTGSGRKPVREIVEQSVTGAATNVIAGMGVGMLSTAIPMLLIAFSIVGAWELAGLYGIAIAAVGMLSNTGIQLAVDAYGPIADNAGGIAEMSGLPAEVRGPHGPAGCCRQYHGSDWQGVCDWFCRLNGFGVVQCIHDDGQTGFDQRGITARDVWPIHWCDAAIFVFGNGDASGWSGSGQYDFRGLRQFREIPAAVKGGWLCVRRTVTLRRKNGMLPTSEYWQMPWRKSTASVASQSRHRHRCGKWCCREFWQ